MKKLHKEELLSGLRRIDELAREEGVLVEMTLYGGAALAIAYDLRDTTRDVDVAIHTQTGKARELIRRVADENEWDENWINDGVKGFLSANEEVARMEAFDNGEAGLSIFVASPRYLFAMKCLAMRVGEAGHDGDREDIENLAGLAGVRTTQEALDLISSFYPDNQVSEKVQFGVEEIMEKIQAKKKYGRTP